MEPIRCVNAENALTLTTAGHGKLCCVFRGRSTDAVPEVPIHEIFQDKLFNRVRKDLSQGIRAPECRVCWQDEDLGQESKRQRDLIKGPWKSGIKILELNLGNACNLRCRTCNAWSSSQWHQESWDTDENIQNQYSKIEWQNIMHKINQPWKSTSDLWRDLSAALGQAEYIDFHGGEPWYNKHHWKILDYCVEKGYSINQRLHYNTNATIWDNDRIEVFRKFLSVEIALSVDGIKERFEMLRYPAKWSNVHDNLYKVKEFGENNDNISVSLHHTVSALNCFYVPEFLNTLGNDFAIWINVVHNPNHWSLGFFPDHVKKIIVEKLQSIDQNKFPHIQTLIDRIEQGKYDEKLWNLFKFKIKQQDEYRSQSYPAVFKEFAQIIEI